MDDVMIPLLVVGDAVYRAAVAGVPLHHQVEDRRDAHHRRREAARRSARRGAPSGRSAVHDRADHDRGKPELAPAMPARPRIGSACSPTESEMAYDRYPLPERNQPQETNARWERGDLFEQPASRTRFYRDKRNGKFFGVCAGIADYTGFDVALVRICFLAAMFMSGGGILPFYFIAAMVTPTKPIALERVDEEEAVLAGRACLADPGGARHQLAVERHRPASRGHRKLCDHRKPHARPGNRAAALSNLIQGGIFQMQHTDLGEAVIVPNLPWMIGGGLILGLVAILGWIFTTWLRVRHGYPLENSWGKAIEPKTVGKESVERIKLLTGENAQLRAELGSLKDRLETVERIVTDQPSSLSKEIEALRLDKGGNA